MKQKATKKWMYKWLTIVKSCVIIDLTSKPNIYGGIKMGTMAKVVFYKKVDETNKFKVEKSFTVMYDGLEGVAGYLMKDLSRFENCPDSDEYIKNIISNFSNYVKYDNKKVANESEKYVDYCYKIYLDPENLEISMSNYGKPLLKKDSFENFEQTVRQTKRRLGF